jgi:RNA polymerase sporulation-specific sigma factor
MASPTSRPTGNTIAREIQLVELARSGNDTAYDTLLRQYLPFVRAKAAQYEALCGDVEAPMRAGIIGLQRAVREFPLERVPRLGPHVELHVTRAIIAASKPPPPHHEP